MSGVVCYLVPMNSSHRHLLAFPTYLLAIIASALFILGGTADAPEAVTAPSGNYMAERHAIVKAEVAREAGGQTCVDPSTLLPGQFPERVLVSTVNVDHAATQVESMTFDKAMSEADAGRVLVRCAII